MQPKLPNLYFDDSDVTESEQSGDNEGQASAEEESLSDSVQEDDNSHAPAKTASKKPLKGVLAIKNVKTKIPKFDSIDEKFAYHQRRLLREQQMRENKKAETPSKEKKATEEEDPDAANFLDELIDQNLAIEDEAEHEQDFLNNITSL